MIVICYLRSKNRKVQITSYFDGSTFCASYKIVQSLPNITIIMYNICTGRVL